MKKKLGNRSLAILLSLITVMSLFTAIPAGSVIAAEAAGETTEVVLAQWSAQDLLDAANATGTKNAATGQPIYDPTLRDWVVGYRTEEANKMGWIFSNAERSAVDWENNIADRIQFTFTPGDELSVVGYFKGSLSKKNTQDKSIGYLSLTVHNSLDYALFFPITEEKLAASELAPERGEGVRKLVWPVSAAESAQKLRPWTGEGTPSRPDVWELRAKAYEGAALECYGVEVYNETKPDDTGLHKVLMAPRLTSYSINRETDTNFAKSEVITKKALAVYNGIKTGLPGGILNNVSNRQKYNAGNASNKEANPFDLIEAMSLGRLYQGNLTLRLDFASLYTLETIKKFTLKVTDETGETLTTADITGENFYKTTDGDAEEAFFADCGFDTQFDLPLIIDSAHSGREYFLSIDTYNSTDLAFFGASLIQEQAAWQAELADQAGNATDGQIVLRDWNWKSLATVDGNHTPSEPNGKEPSIQYSTDAYAGDPENTYKKPVGIEYYFDATTKQATDGGYTSAVVNKHSSTSDGWQEDATIQEISASGAFSQIKISGVSLVDYAGQELTCEMDVYITGNDGWNPWVRLYNGGDTQSALNRAMDLNVNGNPNGEDKIATPVDPTPYTGKLTRGAYGDYQYQSVSASKTIPNTDLNGFRDGFASVWLLVNHYQYTETNTYRVFSYKIKDENGTEIFDLEGEDFIQIAEDQNQRADDGGTAIRARVLWARQEDAFTPGYVTTVGAGESGQTKRLLDLKVPSSLAYRKTDKAGNTALRDLTSTPSQNAASIRSVISFYAPNGFGDHALHLSYYYKDGNGVEQKVGSTDRNQAVNLDTILKISDGGLDGAGKRIYNLEGNENSQYGGSYTVDGSNYFFQAVVARGYLDSVAIEALKQGKIYFCAEFDQEHDFAKYPIQIQRLTVNVLGNGSGYSLWGEEYNVYAGKNRFGTDLSDSPDPNVYKYDYTKGLLTDPTTENFIIYPAIDPLYLKKADKPSEKPLGNGGYTGMTDADAVKNTARTPDQAVKTWLVKDKTYNLGEVSFTAVGQYEMNWKVSGKAGTTFTAKVDRQTLEGTTTVSQKFTLVEGEQTFSFPFQVKDTTDKYTFYISAAGGDVTLFEGHIAASEVALVDGVVYPSFVTAQEKVRAGQGVELLADVDASDVTAVSVPAGTFLDLRGCNLTVRNLAAFGGVADSNASGAPGLLALVDKHGKSVTSAEDAAVILREDNGALPLYDSAKGGYRFFEFTLENAPNTKTTDNGNKVTFGYFLKFDHADAYALMAKGDSGLKMDVDVRWTRSHTYHHTIQDATIKGFGGAVVEKLKTTALSDIKTAVTVTIGGTNALGDDDVLCTTPHIRSVNTRVETAAGEKVHSKIA